MEIQNKKIRLKDILNNYLRTCKILYTINSRYMICIVTITVLLGLCPGISILITQRLINSLQLSEPMLNKTLLFVILYIVLDIINTQLENINSYFTSNFQMKISMHMNLSVLNKTKELELTNFEDSEAYNKIQRAQSQGNAEIYNYFNNFLTMVQLSITTIASAVILLTWRWWSIFLIILVSCLNSYFMTKLSKRQYEIMRKRTGEEREKWYYQYLLTNDIAFKEVKMYGLSDYFIKKFRILAEKFIVQDKAIIKDMTILNFLIAILEQFIVAGLFALIIADTFLKKIMVGDTIAYIRCISTIKSNVKSLLSRMVTIYKDTLYINQLFEFLDMDTKKVVPEAKILQTIDIIEIKNLSYRYNRAKAYAIRDISLTIRKGDMYIIVGPNGSGKSTLVKILSGFYDDYEGEIFINHINLRSIDTASLRKQIGILFQDFNKYELTVRENVGLGNLEELQNDDILRSAMDISGVKQALISELNQQLGFWFNEGIQLSGGEWIRLGISRAFVRAASMYILDEPNASLDSIAENTIFKSMQELMKKNIGIIITHRIASIKVFKGSILVMDQGRVTDCGTHDELLTRSVLYRDLYNNSNY